MPSSFPSPSRSSTPVRSPSRPPPASSATPAKAAANAMAPGPGLAGFHAYTVALEFYRLVFQATKGKIQHERIDQIVRAAESVVRNLGEGHPTVGADRARRFRLAANGACECAASLDILEIRGEVSAAALAEMRVLLDRMRAMLWRLSRPL